jgi:basic membrane protein A
VHDTVVAAAAGDFEGGLYVGTLENDGVGLAPFHDFEDSVPAEVQDQIAALTEQIISGEIETSPGG